MKFHTSLVETSNSEAGSEQDAAQEPSLEMVLMLEQTEERLSCWEKATPEWSGHSRYGCLETFHHHRRHLEKAFFVGTSLDLHFWVFSL